MICASGCELAPDLEGYPAEMSAEAEAAEWPRLVDIPAPAEATANAPSPTTGLAIVADLTHEAQASSAQAEAVAEPVFAVAPLRAEAEAVRRGR